jgi:hypothetical protein
MILDTIATWVRRFLGVFEADTAEVLFLPIFVLTVVISFVLVVHKLGKPASRLAAVVLTWTITAFGALALLVEMVVAEGYRRRGVRAPSVVYNAGDVVAAWAAGLTAGVLRLTTLAAGVMSRAKVPVLILLSAGWIWLWNYQHCPDGAVACDRPVHSWFQRVSDEQP